MNIGFILAGGSGTRFGATCPKQFMSMNGSPVIQYTINNLYKSKTVDKIIVACHPDWVDYCCTKLKHIDAVILGGANRAETVINCARACDDYTEFVLFQDSVRPFTPITQYQKVMNILQNNEYLDYCVTAQQITDALCIKKDNLITTGINRENYRLCQTPEVLRYSVIKSVYLGSDNKDLHSAFYIAQACDNRGYFGTYIDLQDLNLKITYDYDLFNAEQMMKFSRPDLSENSEMIGRKVLLIGGSGDIGKALNNRLTSLGAIVDAPSSSQLNVADLHYRAEKYRTETYDCVINCAGAYTVDGLQFSDQMYQIMKTNFEGVVELIDLCKTQFLKAGGNLVLLGSASATYGRKGFSVYSASKAAINSFVEATKENLIESNIRINVICPAKVKGKLQKFFNVNANQDEMIDPGDLAKIIVNYVCTENYGQIVYIRNGMEK